MNKICGNCGQKGHVYKNCKAPITSFGIIAFRQNNFDYIDNEYYKSLFGIYPHLGRNEEIKILLIQRKDTMGYIDFIRGKYESEKYLIKSLNEMTPYEIHRLQTMSFDDLWDDLWADHNCKYYKNDKKTAKRKFNKLDLSSLIIKSSPKWSFQEFGLPKGRRNMKEKNRDCAQREFEEETGYNRNDYIILKKLGKLEENFTGSNDIQYRHIYYIAEINNNASYPYFNINNIHQKSELNSIDMFTRNEIPHVIRDYDIEKKKIIDIAFELFIEYKKNPFKQDKYFHYIKKKLLNS